jgi:hypothetical protein
VGYDISYIAPIYINDGSGKFTKDTSNDLKGVSSSSIAIADLDSDSDKDILITGFDDASYDSYSKIYLNNASGTFTQDSNSLEKVYLSSVAVGDLDGDDYKDILLTGYIYDDDSPISKIYLNDGIGNFTPDDSNSLIDVQLSSVVIADLDGDDDSDILLTGQDSNSNKISKIYLNNGEGNFTEDSNSLEGVSHSSVAIADLDGDDDNDILLTGKKLNGDAVSKIYLNDGNGKFSEDITNSL